MILAKPEVWWESGSPGGALNGGRSEKESARASIFARNEGDTGCENRLIAKSNNAINTAFFTLYSIENIFNF
jgi:hypothetical protein